MSHSSSPWTHFVSLTLTLNAGVLELWECGVFEGISSSFEENYVPLTFFWVFGQQGMIMVYASEEYTTLTGQSGGFIFRLSQIYGALFKKVVEWVQR